MSRLVFTEKSEDYLATLAEEQAMSKNENSHLMRESSNTKIRRNISAVLKSFTPNDEYQKKILDLANISKNSEAIQVYLVPKSLSKEIPAYMKKKIDHITKIITNTKKSSENKEIIDLNATNDSVISQKKQNSFHKNDENNFLQRKCNTLLYSENYLERLTQRYKNYLDKNKNINLRLDKQYTSNRETRNEKKKLGIDDKIKIENEKQNELLNFKTKYAIRFRKRLGDYHKKHFIKVWEKNKLPPIGLKDNIETVRELRKEKKNALAQIANK